MFVLLFPLVSPPSCHVVADSMKQSLRLSLAPCPSQSRRECPIYNNVYGFLKKKKSFLLYFFSFVCLFCKFFL